MRINFKSSITNIFRGYQGYNKGTGIDIRIW